MGRRLKYLRELNEETQKVCANYYNVTRSTYAGWENDKDYMPLEKIIMACNKNKVSIDYITGLSDVNTYTTELKLDPKVIAESLFTLRKTILNYTQDKFSKAININQSTYSAYETGKLIINANTLYNTCYVYEISQDDIVKGNLK